MTDNATPRPWRLIPADRAKRRGPHHPNIMKPDRVSFYVYGDTVENEDADAELVVRAVNSHDSLVEALEKALAVVAECEQTRLVQDASKAGEAALAAAKDPNE